MARGDCACFPAPGTSSISQQVNVAKLSLVFCLVGCLGGLSCDSRAAVAGGEMPMPDRVVVKEGTAVPPGIPGPEIACLILEENATALRVDVSTFRGIQQVVVIPRSDVVKVVRGDAGMRPWYELGRILQWPRHSRPAVYYEVPLKKLEAFLKQYPESPRAADAVAERTRWLSELEKVRQGHFRILDRWFKPAELGDTDRLAWTFRNGLPGDEAPAVLEDWEALLKKLQTHHASRFYPALQEEVRRLAALRRSQFGESFPKNKADWAVLEEPLEPLWEAWGILSGLDVPAMDLSSGREPFLNALQRVRGLWKDLEWTDTLLDAGLDRVREQAGRDLGGGNPAPAYALVGAWKPALALFPQGSESRTKWEAWFAAKDREQADSEELALLEKALADKDSALLEKRLPVLLGRTHADDGALRRRVLEIKKVYQEWKAAEAAEELQRLVAGKQYDGVLALARDKRLKMEASGGDWEILQQQQADILVEVAQNAFGEYRFWTSWRLVLEAWRTKPGNVKAQMAITLGAAGAFVVLLVLALPVLLVYAWLSQMINQVFFRRRLRLTRMEEERHLRRQREAASLPDPPAENPPE